MPGFTLTYQPTESDVNIPPEAIRKRTNRVRSEMGTKAQHDLEPAHEYPLPLHLLQHLSNCYRTLLANRCTLVAQYGKGVKPWDQFSLGNSFWIHPLVELSVYLSICCFVLLHGIRYLLVAR